MYYSRVQRIGKFTSLSCKGLKIGSTGWYIALLHEVLRDPGSPFLSTALSSLSR